MTTMVEPYSWSNQSAADGSLQEFNEKIRAVVGPLQIDADSPEEFVATVSRRILGRFSITSTSSSACRIKQNTARRSEMNDFRFGLHYVREGRIVYEQGGQRLVTLPGDFVLLDNSRSYEFRAPSNVRCVCMDVSENWLRSQLRDPFACVMRQIDRTSLWAKTLGAMMSSMGNSDQRGLDRHGTISEQVGGFMTLLFDEQSATLTSHRLQLKQSIIEVMRSHYSDAELKPNFVARSVGISTRSLCLTLASAGTTFGKELLQLRIAKARKLLANADFSQLSIGEIAWRCGFEDPSYFARCFSRHVGCSPRSFRLGAARRETAAD